MALLTDVNVAYAQIALGHLPVRCALSLLCIEHSVVVAASSGQPPSTPHPILPVLRGTLAIERPMRASSVPVHACAVFVTLF